MAVKSSKTILAQLLLPATLLASNGAAPRTSPEPQVLSPVATTADADAGPRTYEETSGERLAWQLPDPDSALELHARLEPQAAAEKFGKKSDAAFHRHVLEWIRPIKRSRRLRLTLPDALHRALANNFAIRVESYNPAIETTRVVEAQAAFDATFFFNLSNNKQDQPTPTSLSASSAETLIIEGGIRQLLPTGMQMSTSLSTTRTSRDFVFQTLDPAYFSQFVVEFRQPLLRGFGLDFNRSQINITKNNRRISDLAFRRGVRNTLLDTEIAFWRLAQARRRVPVSARLIAGFQQIYDDLWERRHFDVLPIQLSETKARLEAAKSDHVRVLNEVRNAEDVLIALMNDPQVDLADDVEILPADVADARNPLRLSRAQVLIDRLAEVQAALDHREEIKEAKLQIDNAKIFVGAAKVEAMPKFDVVFRYSVDGLGASADTSFDEVTRNNFHEYFVAVELELPVGNRARRAALRRRRLQHAQAMAALKQTFERVILDVNLAVRRLSTAFDVIRPNYVSMEATEDRLESIVVRAERRDFVQLNQELNSHNALFSARLTMLDSLVDYNIAIVELEQAKGTLLEYDGVSITGEPGE